MGLATRRSAAPASLLMWSSLVRRSAKQAQELAGPTSYFTSYLYLYLAHTSADCLWQVGPSGWSRAKCVCCVYHGVWMSVCVHVGRARAPGHDTPSLARGAGGPLTRAPARRVRVPACDGALYSRRV